MRRADGAEQLDDLRALLVVEDRAGALVGRVHRLVERGDQARPLRRDVAEHLRRSGVRALAHHVAGGLELVEQPRDPGRLLDHPVADGERRKAGLARAAEDPQHVVLLDGDAVRLDDLREVALHHGRRAEDADDDFLGGDGTAWSA